jgi:hypothetical protein
MKVYMKDGNDEHSFSIFGGFPLAKIRELDPGLVHGVAGLGIRDAEQLLELIHVEATVKHLAEHLGLSDKALLHFVSLVENGVPRERRVPPVILTRGPFSLGALEPNDRTRADTGPLPKIGPALSLPSQINHISSMLPITAGEGERKTCVAFGVTALTEYYWTINGRRTKLSEQFLFQETKQKDSLPGMCGTYLVYAMRVVQELGICPDAVWSYNPNLPCTNNGTEPPNAKAAAASFRAEPHFLNPKDVNAMKSELAQNRNVAFVIPVYESWYESSSTRRTGYITMRIGGESKLGDHCMCFVGYQDDDHYPGGG